MLIQNYTINDEELMLTTIQNANNKKIAVMQGAKSGWVWEITNTKGDIMITGFNKDTLHECFQNPYRSDLQ